jgi:hypothetical protein
MNANTSFNAYQVTEIQLTNKTSARLSERPKLLAVKMLTRSSYKTGMTKPLSFVKNSKFYY